MNLKSFNEWYAVHAYRSNSKRQVGPSNSRQSKIPRQAARGGGGERVGVVENPSFAIKTFLGVSLNLSIH